MVRADGKGWLRELRKSLDVLVLQVPGGKDTVRTTVSVTRIPLMQEQFITLQATFLPSIISLPLHLLASLTTPIRDVSLAERRVLSTVGVLSDEAPRGPKPVKEVWRLLEYLMSNGSGVGDLWVQEVKLDELLRIIEVCLSLLGSIRLKDP